MNSLSIVVTWTPAAATAVQLINEAYQYSIKLS